VCCDCSGRYTPGRAGEGANGLMRLLVISGCEKNTLSEAKNIAMLYF